MVERDPIGNDLRKRSRGARLGQRRSCLICGQLELEALALDPTPISELPARIIEEHHLAGVANDPEATVLLCRNHHAIVGEMQRLAGAELSHDDRIGMERLAELLLGLSVFLEMLANALERWYEWLTAWIDEADRRSLEWRDIPDP